MHNTELTIQYTNVAITTHAQYITYLPKEVVQKNTECGDNKQCQDSTGNITIFHRYHDCSAAKDREKNSG